MPFFLAFFYPFFWSNLTSTRWKELDIARPSPTWGSTTRLGAVGWRKDAAPPPCGCRGKYSLWQIDALHHSASSKLIGVERDWGGGLVGMLSPCTLDAIRQSVVVYDQLWLHLCRTAADKAGGRQFILPIHGLPLAKASPTVSITPFWAGLGWGIKTSLCRRK